MHASLTAPWHDAVHRVKQEPRQPQRPAQQRVGAGAPAVSRQELLAMHEKMTEYKRHADINYARFKGSISRQVGEALAQRIYSRRCGRQVPPGGRHPSHVRGHS